MRRGDDAAAVRGTGDVVVLDPNAIESADESRWVLRFLSPDTPKSPRKRCGRRRRAISGGRFRGAIDDRRAAGGPRSRARQDGSQN